MKPPRFSVLVLLAALIPALSFGADKKRPKKSADRPGGAGGEMMKTFDKNGNQQIDADELPAVQQAFSALRNLDKNSNGEIELTEVERPKGADDRRGRMLAGFKKVDKNGNRKIDADEIEALQKALKGGQMMSKLDQNGNGTLEPSEVERLNQRLSQRMPGKTAAPKESPKPAPEAPKPEEKKPDAPPPAAGKPPGNFGS